ncbi:YchJ family protein [Saccharospirillum alexandrii]|uniref:YchJ family protein n=1 Tax=Saccharospirillum alexandrii TaxID=2448477 RepID=UPI000FDC169E|nr:YchJ family metal-binding protein [Saccharospirillum alexandrii]
MTDASNKKPADTNPGSGHCHCGQTEPYLSCCGRFLEAGAYPRDPETLMRSRFTAYRLQRLNYLIRTWHPDTCPALTADHLEGTDWQQLQVIRSKAGLKKGWVEFIAQYVDEQDKPEQLHEISEFRKVKNRWVYHSELQSWPGE